MQIEKTITFDARRAPIISVVIATYNRASLLRETLDSIVTQSFQDFEVIVVDDGSTDETEAVVKSYGELLRYIRQENRGPSGARNVGIQNARAKWISIQDSDDICTPDHLESLYRIVEKRNDLGMVFANGGYVGGPKEKTIIPQEKSKRLAQNGVRLLDLFDVSIVRLQAALLSRQVLLAIGGLDETLRIAMDLDLAFRVIMRFPVAYLDKVVFFYRRHEGSIGGDEELRQLENLKVIDKLVQEFPETIEMLGRQRINRRKAHRFYRLAKWRWKIGERDGAREAIRNAIILRPYFPKYRLYQLLGEMLYSRPVGRTE
jgi:glycosyltransferase involved in cell wall biosynthesis